LSTGAIGKAQVAGVCPALVDIQDAEHRYARLPAGEYVLKSDTSGPVRIVQKPDETGVVLCVILFGEDLQETGTLVAFELADRAESLDDYPQPAYLLDDSGERVTEGSDPDCEVWAHPILSRIYGPAEKGFRGWATRQDPSEEYEGEGGGSGRPYYMIVHMQRFAQYLAFAGVDFSLGCDEIPLDVESIGSYWHGEDPLTEDPDTGLTAWIPQLFASHHPACLCLGSAGIAVLDEKSSEFPYLDYRVIEVDQMLEIAAFQPCQTSPGVFTHVKRLLFGDGINLVPCGDCAVGIEAAGLTVTATDCELDEEE